VLEALRVGTKSRIRKVLAANDHSCLEHRHPTKMKSKSAAHDSKTVAMPSRQAPRFAGVPFSSSSNTSILWVLISDTVSPKTTGIAHQVNRISRCRRPKVSSAGTATSLRLRNGKSMFVTTLALSARSPLRPAM
jgi:hypothetical protein